MIAPPTIGNADPEWQLPRGPGGAPMQGAVVVQAIDAYPNPLPRKCVWAMLLLSCLLVLRVQQDRYTEVVHWRGGVPDMGSPFPWELDALVSGSDAFEATFLSPILRKASTFLRSSAETSMLITGLARTVMTGGDGPSSVQPNGSPALGVSAMTSSADLPPPTCLGNGSSCYVGVQKAIVPPRAYDQLGAGSGQIISCHRFVAGSSPEAMRPLHADANRSQVLCVRSSSRIQAMVATRANGSTVLAWDAPLLRLRQQIRSRPCLAVVSLPDLRVGVSMLSESSAATVLYDQGSNLFITVGFSSVQTIIVNAFDPVTLKHLWRYRLPLTVAWLLRAPKVSNGYLLFVGSEEPFLGTTFTIDLMKSQVYEQSPPSAGGGRRRPRRRRLPRSMVVERPSTSRTSSSLAGTRGACTLAAVPESHDSTALKGDVGKGASDAAVSGQKAGPPR